MRSTRNPLVILLSLFLTILVGHITARADENDAEEYDVSARVVRISLLHSDVSLKRHDSDDWETARLNMPLVEGDTLATGSDARAEIQIDSRNFVRVASDSIIKIITLRHDGIALSLTEGTATLRLARFDREHEYFEIDAPKTTIAAEQQGTYRIDVARNGGIHVTVRDGGRARLYSETAGFTIKAGRRATLNFDGDEAGEWQLVSVLTNDSWDDWVTDRERYLTTRFKYEQAARYYESDIWGAEDLDAYGSWAYVNDYGWIWRPNVTIINNYNDWAPYRYGSWSWCDPYGWTWVGDEPWGWAPYHYGRWVYYNNYWAWCPHSYYPHRRSWWRPALVAFVSIDFDFGSHYCWYPLSYHQHDPRSNYFRSRERLTPLSSTELADLRRANPAYLRAVTAVPARDFGNRTARLQPASGDLARRVIGAQPVRGELPTRRAANNDPTAAAGRTNIARPASAVPGAALAQRPTGAATRTPGVPLDNDLRHLRIFNGRDPASTTPTNNVAGAPDARPTGAVARPARPSSQPINRGTDPGRGVDGDGTPVERSVRPARPREDRPAPPDPAGNIERRDRSPDVRPPTRAPREDRPATPPDRPPERGDRNPPAQPPSRPSDPDSGSKPARPDRVERPERDDRQAPRQRDESPAPRSQPPARSEPPPERSSPAPQRSEPPARSDPPQRSEPPARSDPPPRSESPRSDPPPRSESPSRPGKPPAGS